MPMPERRERKDAAEHRRLILRTAQALFDEHGVHTVSMHQIAKTAGIGQATLYRRYSHKGDLCIDLLQDFIGQWMESIATYLDNAKGELPMDRLGGIIDRWIDALEEKSELIATIEPKGIDCEDERGNFFHSPMYKFLRDKLSDLLAESLTPLPNKPAIDERLTAHALICSMTPSGYFHLKHEGYSTESIKTGYRQMCHLTVQ